MAGIFDQTSLASTIPQEQAANNVANSNLLTVPPDFFAQNKEQFKPIVDSAKLPTDASPVVARNIAQSKQHAAAISPDSDLLSTAENIWKSVGRSVGDAWNDPEEERRNLWMKQMNQGGQLDDDDRATLASLNDQASHVKEPDFGLTQWWEKAPAKIAGIVAGVPAMINRNKELFGSIVGTETAASAATGALVGSAAGGVGAIPGAITGAGIGLGSGVGHAFLATMAYDSYKQGTAEMYGQLGDLQKPDGTPLVLDEPTRANISRGLGMVTAAFNTAAGEIGLNNIPFVKNLVGRGGAKFIAASPQLRQALAQYGSTALTLGSVGALSTMASNLAKELAQTKGDSSELSFTNALLNYDKHFVENTPQMDAQGQPVPGTGSRSQAVDSFLEGVLGGVVLHGAGDLTQRTVNRAFGPKASVTAAPQPSDIPATTAAHPYKQVQDALNLQETMDASRTIVQETGLHKIDPKQTSEITRQILDDNGIKKLYADKEDVQQFINAGKNDVEKAARAQDWQSILDPKGTTDAATDAPVAMDPAKVMELHHKYDDFSHYVKLTPEGPSANSARTWLEKAQKVQQNSTEVLQSMGADKSVEQRAYEDIKLTPEMSDEQIASSIKDKESAQAYLDRLDVNATAEAGNEPQLQEIQAMKDRVTQIAEQLPSREAQIAEVQAAARNQLPSNEVWNESDYVNQPKLSEAIREIAPDAEAERLDSALEENRREIATHINDSAAAEMNEVRDIYKEMFTEGVRQQELDKMQNSPNVDMTETFLNSLSKEPHLSFAIDPKSLSEAQAKLYRKDAKLKERKVFKKDGMPASEVARLLGANNPDTLLRILRDTPTREEFVQERLKVRKQEIERNAAKAVDLDHSAISDAYHKATENYTATMKWLKDNKWPETKAAIKRIALPIPSVEELRGQAEDVVAGTRIGDLNSKQYKVAERRANRTAVQKILNGDILGAFTSKRNAALSSEMTLATMKGTADVNKLVRTALRFKDPEFRAEIGKAGVSFIRAADEIFDHFNLDPSMKGESKSGSYVKWVKNMIEQGNGDFSINPTMSDPRRSINDLTVQEARLLDSRLKTIAHSAKIENDLILQRDEAKVQVIADQLHEHLVTHPDYDLAKVEKMKLPQEKAPSFAFRLHTVFTDMATNIDFFVKNLDKDSNVGPFKDLIGAVLTGTGKYSEMGQGGYVRDLAKLDKFYDEQIIKKIGKDEFEKMRITYFDIPEFKGIPELRNGHLSKAELFVQMLNRMNGGNLEELKKFGNLDEATFQAVHDRYLEDKYADAAQAIAEHYQNEFFPRVSKMHFDVTGETPRMVQAREWTHRNVKRPGGYYPIVRESDMSVEAIRKRDMERIDDLMGDNKGKFNANVYYASDMTEHGHTEQRLGSDKKLSMNIGTLGMGFEARAHDLNFRLPLRDTLKILNHEKVAQDIGGVLGRDGYNQLVSNVVHLARNSRLEASAAYDAHELSAVAGQIISRTAASQLLLKPKTVLIQATSALLVFKEIGPVTFAKHFGEIVGKMAMNPTLIKDFSKAAMDLTGDVLPSFRATQENLGGTMRDSFRDKLGASPLGLPESMRGAEDRANKISAGLGKMTGAVNKMAWGALGVVDELQKVISVNVAYKSFLAGDVAGWSKEKLSTMTALERDHQAKVYAAELARTNLTSNSEYDRAMIQRGQAGAIFNPYWSDGRNVWGQLLRTGRQVRQGAVEAGKAVGQKDFGRAASATAKAAYIGFQGWAMITALNYFQDLRYGFEAPDPTDLINNPKTFGSDMMSFALQSMIHGPLGEAPFIRSAEFLYQMRSDKGSREQHVSIPLLGAIDNFSNMLTTAGNFMDGYDMTEKDYRNTLELANLFTSGLPIQGAFQAYHTFSDMLDNGVLDEIGKGKMFAFNQQADKFLKKQEAKQVAGEEKLPDDVLAEIARLKRETDQAAIDK